MEIKCEFKHHNYYLVSTSSATNLYTCYVSMPRITAPRTTIRAFEGVHLNGKSNEDVEAIRFTDGNVPYFPRGMPQIFPHLRAMHIKNCGLLQISRADLRGFHSLEILWLQSNKLKYLPSDLLIGMNKLKSVSFRDNQIECLSSEILKPIIDNGMESIHFRRNKTISALYAPGDGDSVSSIEELMKIIDIKCTKPDLSKTVYFNSHKEKFYTKTASVVENLWNSKKFSDFTIIAGEKKFDVHKFVLEAHSVEFAAILQSREKEVNEMNIKDLNVEVVEAFLRYLYTGDVSNNVDSFELFALSSKLGVLDLKNICKEMIIDSLQESNAFKILNLGHTYNCEEFKKEAFDEICRTFPNIDLSDDLMEKPEDLKKLVEAKQFYESMIAKFKKM